MFLRRHLFCLRKCAAAPLFLCLLPCLLVELCSFWMASLSWELPDNSSGRSNPTISILVMADPQLIGQRNEPKWIGWLTRWDADRYLSRSYAQVFASVRPDLEIFLGDLFDEGIYLEDEQFAQERKRFLRIFPPNNNDWNASRIYIAGDNDIGGEFEPVYTNLMGRFRNGFPAYFDDHFLALDEDTLTIYEANAISFGEFNGIYGTRRADTSKSIRLLLSHFPIVPRMTPRMEQELRRINVVLSAHDHTTALYMQWRHSPDFRRTAAASEVATARWTISMREPAELPLVEFKVPTISYRMGVPAMGYGLVLLTPFPANGTAIVQFAILWLPSRFLQLLLYALLLLFGILWTVRRRIYGIRRKSAWARTKKRKKARQQEEEAHRLMKANSRLVGSDV